MAQPYHANTPEDKLAAAELDWAHVTERDKAEFWAGYEEFLDSLPGRENDPAGQVDCCPQFTDRNGNLRRLAEPKSNGNINGIEV